MKICLDSAKVASEPRATGSATHESSDFVGSRGEVGKSADRGCRSTNCNDNVDWVSFPAHTIACKHMALKQLAQLDSRKVVHGHYSSEIQRQSECAASC